MSSQRKSLVILLALSSTIEIAGCRKCITCSEGVSNPSTVTASGCEYKVIETPQKIHSNQGGNGGFSVSTNPQTCDWTVASNDSWIVITAGQAGRGNGQANYDVKPNSGGGRTGSITVRGTGGVVKIVTVVQNPR